MQKKLQTITIPAREGCDKHTLAFYDYGDPDAAQTALCVHGLARNADDFDFLAQKLAASGMRVMAIDMAGRGNSEWLKDPMQYHYGNYLADCLTLMDNFHIRKTHFIGTSMGGIIGMMIAATEPRRVKRLVLNDIGSFIPQQALARIYGYVRAIPLSFSSYEQADSYFQTNYAGFGITDDAQWRNFVTSSITGHDDGSYTLRCDPNIAEFLRVSSKDFTDLHDVNLAEFWEKIKAPVLVIRGRESDVLPEHTLHAMRASNARTETITFDGIGHAPALLNEQQVNPILRFLQTSGNIPLAVGL